MSNILYFIKQSIQGIKAHKIVTVATICVLTISMLLIGTFSLIYSNINNTINGMKQGNSFIAYVDDNLSDEKVKEIETQIMLIDTVSDVEFESRDQAMKEFVEYMKDPSLGELPSTVLRHRYIIQSDSAEVLPDTIEKVEKISGIASVSASLEVAQGFVDLESATTAISSVIIAVLVMFSFFMIVNVIKIVALSRKKEIGIMSICGVPNWFIRSPFYFEGIIIGLVSAILSYIGETLIYDEIVRRLTTSEASKLIEFADFSQYKIIMLIFFVGAGLVIGITATIWSVNQAGINKRQIS